MTVIEHTDFSDRVAFLRAWYLRTGVMPGSTDEFCAAFGLR